ncbi:HAD hydrolase-like protein [bacterium]|nr:HAD hydrolase-like protein [bacterium]
MTLEDAIKLFFSFFESEEYRETQPVSGAYEKLYELKEAGNTLFVVTARNKPFEEQTRKRVETHFP